MDIDAVIAEGVAASAADAQPKADAKVENNEVTQESPDSEVTEQTTPEPKETEEPWPKKAENALAKAKGKAAQLKAERDQERAARQRLEQQLAQFNGQQKKPETAKEPTGEPQESDFTSYAEYMRAVQKYDLKQEIAKLEGKQHETRQSQQEQAWVAEREQAVAVKAQEFAKENPELLEMVEEYGDVVDEFPPYIQRAFLEADNAALAFYNLVKEGKLEALASMSPARAAMEIGRAQTQAAKPKPVTKAPTPITPAKGTATGGKSLDRMSWEETKQWLEAR